MYMYGGIDERQWLEMQVQTLKVVDPLIRAELEVMYKSEIKDLPIPDTEDVSAIVQKILQRRSARPDESPKAE